MVSSAGQVRPVPIQEPRVAERGQVGHFKIAAVRHGRSHHTQTALFTGLLRLSSTMYGLFFVGSGRTVFSL